MSAPFKVKKALFIYKYYNPATQRVAKLYSMAKDTGFDLLLKQDMRYEKEFQHQIILPLFTSSIR